jgi:prolipoprotein diacylglyceryltransferase
LYEWKLLPEPVEFLGITFTYGNYYLSHPWELLYVWRGGLASHGGAIGILIAVYFYNKNVSKKGFIWIMDRLVIGVALTAFAIRFGNLMNSEIYGPMHPTQIYEMIYAIVAFIVSWWMYWKKQAYKQTGLIFGVFLIIVFASRFLIEFIKLNQEEFEAGMLLNMGQILSIPFIVWGVYLIYRAKTTPLSPKGDLTSRK